MEVYKARHFDNLTHHGRVATRKLSVSEGFQSKITERNCDRLDLKMTSSEPSSQYCFFPLTLIYSSFQAKGNRGPE